LSQLPLQAPSQHTPSAQKPDWHWLLAVHATPCARSASQRPLSQKRPAVHCRVVVHEVNGGEALELSMAMAGRQDGTLFSSYASTARDCLDRLETMIRMAGLDVQAKVVREQIAASVNVVVALTRFADGTSRVTQIAEVTGVEVDLVTTQDIFTFKRERLDDDGHVQGRFQATGSQPRFYEELQRRGDHVDVGIFREH
jgi:pilus assembly protein CpaF